MSKSLNLWDKTIEKLFNSIKFDDVKGMKDILSNINSKPLVENLLQSCHKLDKCRQYGKSAIFTPLQYAVYSENISVVKYLVEEVGVNVDQEGDGYTENLYPHLICHTALCHAIKRCNRHDVERKSFKIAEVLVKKLAADVNLVPKEGFAPLFLACNEGHLDIVKLLVNNGAKLDICKLEDGKPTALPLLMISVKMRHTELVKYLIEQGVSVNEQDNFGHTPLHIADDDDIIKMLLENGAGLCKDKFGMTPLYRACMENREGDLELMVEHFQENHLLSKEEEILIEMLSGLGKLLQCDDEWLTCFNNAVDEYTKCKEINKIFEKVGDLEVPEIIDFVKELIAMAELKDDPIEAYIYPDIIRKAILLMQAVLGQNYPDLIDHLSHLSNYCQREDEWIAIILQMQKCLKFLVKPLSLVAITASAVTLGCQVPSILNGYHDPPHGIVFMGNLFHDEVMWDEYLNNDDIYKFYEKYPEPQENEDIEVFEYLAYEFFQLVEHFKETDSELVLIRDILEKMVNVLKQLFSEKKCAPYFFHRLFEITPPKSLHSDARADLNLINLSKIVGMLSGLDVDYRDKCGNTPLHMIVKNCSSFCGDVKVKKELVNMIKLLIEKGARINSRNHEGLTAFDLIDDTPAHSKDPELLKLINPKGKCSTLQDLCTDVVKEYRLQYIYSLSIPENIKLYIAKS